MTHAFKNITSAASKRAALAVKKRHGSFINASKVGSRNKHGIVVVDGTPRTTLALDGNSRTITPEAAREVRDMLSEAILEAEKEKQS